MQIKAQKIIVDRMINSLHEERELIDNEHPFANYEISVKSKAGTREQRYWQPKSNNKAHHSSVPLLDEDIFNNETSADFLRIDNEKIGLPKDFIEIDPLILNQSNSVRKFTF